MEPILVSVREACGLLSIKKTKLFELLKERALERKKIGGKTLVTLDSIRALASDPAARTSDAGAACEPPTPKK